MELKWLEDLLAVAELRNFSRAATARNITQPALSRHIRALELWHGVMLVDRSSYPVTLTPAGEALLPVARHAVAELQRCRREARAASRAGARSLVFAMPHALASHFFPTWWRQHRQATPMHAKVVAADFDDCVELLVTGACHYMLCYSQHSVPRELDKYKLRHRNIGQDTLRPYSALDASGVPIHPLVSGGTVPLLAYDRGSYLGRLTSALYPRVEALCALELAFESAFVDALKAQVLVGDGIAWLPDQAVQTARAAGQVQPVGPDDFSIALQVLLLWPDTGTPDLGPRDFAVTLP